LSLQIDYLIKLLQFIQQQGQTDKKNKYRLGIRRERLMLVFFGTITLKISRNNHVANVNSYMVMWEVLSKNLQTWNWNVK